MKRLLPLIIVTLCAGSSFAQLNVWRWQNPLPMGNFLRAVQMISRDTIYVCGDEASFMSSIDGGQSWNVQSRVLNSKANLNALHFLDHNYGMCCGDSGKVFKTTDGGASWKALVTKTIIKFNGVCVVDKSIAILVTEGGAIMRTVDGGVTWTTIPVEVNYKLYSIRKLKSDFISITGYGGTLLISKDKGLTWPLFTTGLANTYYSADFSDELNGTMIGEYGIILHTTDGGTTWKRQEMADSSIISASLNVIDGKDPMVMAIAGDYGTMLYTTNAGVTWSESFLGTAEPIKGLSFFDKTTATAVGRNGLIIQTSDGGATWNYVPHKPFTEILHAVAFPKGDTSVGLAVGDRGTILRTPDGGKTWTLVPSGFVGKLKGVCFTDPSTAIAVGEGGWILKSIDGGMNWNRRPSGTTKNLNAVSFCSAGTGVIVGDSGMILRSYSSGEFWGQMFTTPVTRTEYFRGVSFPDSLHAYICGEATVYNSTDGGFTWEATKGGSESPGESISFADSIHGGFVHTDRFGVGYVQVTSNGGVSFDSIYPPYSTKGGDHSLSGIFFTDRQHATVVGVLGYIAHSTNGGKTWTEQQSNTLNNLNAVAFGSVKAGTAVGYRGNIMRITTNEKLAAPTPTAMGSPKAILDPCYPNPATSTINISFSLPASGSASIKLYTIDGKEITMAADGFMEAGEHRTLLDLTSLSSGSYILSLSFGGAIVSQTVHLVR